MESKDKRAKNKDKILKTIEERNPALYNRAGFFVSKKKDR